MNRRQTNHYLYVLIFPNGKKYYGYSQDVEKRWLGHENTAKRGKLNTPVYAAIRHYGWNNVQKKLVLVGGLSYVLEMEAKCIASFNTFVPNGYNLAPGGVSSPASHPEVAARISKSMVTHYQNPTNRERVSARNTGQVMTAEQNAKNSAAKIKNWQTSGYRENQVAKRLGKKDTEITAQQKAAKAKEAWARPGRRQRGREVMLGNTNTLGWRWFNNGVKQISIAPEGCVPENFFPGMLKGKRTAGKVRITNGTNERCVPPGSELPEGWYLGRKPSYRRAYGPVGGSIGSD